MPTKHASRRGIAILVLVLVISLLTLAALTLGAGSRDDLSLAASRIETCRAFLAAESASRVVMHQVREGDPITIGDPVAELLQATGTVVHSNDTDGIYTVQGQSGQAVRLIQWDISP